MFAMMSLRITSAWLRLGIAILASVVALTACSEERSEGYLRIGANPWAGYEPFFIADELNLFRPGYVHMVETPQALGLSQALRNGTIDAAAMTLSRVIRWPDPASRPVVLMVLDHSNGLDKVMARPGIQSVADLRGRRVGAELDTVNGYVLARALELNGLSLDDVTVVNLENDELHDAYVSGDIDAMAGFGRPIAAARQDGAVELFSSAEIPGEIIDIFVARPDSLEEHPMGFEEAILGWMRAMDTLATWPEDEDFPSGALRPGVLRNQLDGVQLSSAANNLNLMREDTGGLHQVIERRWQAAIARGVAPAGHDAPRIDPRPFMAAYKRYLAEVGR